MRVCGYLGLVLNVRLWLRYFLWVGAILGVCVLVFLWDGFGLILLVGLFVFVLVVLVVLGVLGGFCGLRVLAVICCFGVL